MASNFRTLSLLVVYFCASTWSNLEVLTAFERMAETAKNNTKGWDNRFPFWHIEMGALLQHMVEEETNIWAVTNSLFSACILFANVAIVACLGGLSRYESTKLSERLLRICLSRGLLVFAILFGGLAPKTVEKFLWIMWHIVAGHLHLLMDVSKTRWESLCTLPPFTYRKWVPPCCLLLFSLGTAFWLGRGFFECLKEREDGMRWIAALDLAWMLTRGSKSLVRYCLCMWEIVINPECTDGDSLGNSERRNTILYHTDFYHDVVSISLVIVSRLFLKCLTGLSFGAVDIMLFFDIKTNSTNLTNRVRQYVEFRKVTKAMSVTFREAMPWELEEAGDCVICRERLNVGKVLPCGHIFHIWCVRSWLQQCGPNNYNCPLCRASIVLADDRGYSSDDYLDTSNSVTFDTQLRRASTVETSSYTTGSSSEPSFEFQQTRAYQERTSSDAVNSSNRNIWRPRRVWDWSSDETVMWSANSSLRALSTIANTLTGHRMDARGAVAGVRAEDGEEVTSNYVHRQGAY